MGGITDIFGGGGRDAADASREAADVAAKSEQDKLNYLKEINKLPQQYRDKALARINDIYNQDPTNNPMYLAQMENINQMQKNQADQLQAGAAAGGTLRGGNFMGDIAGISQSSDMARNQVLSNAYYQQMKGLSSLAGIDTGTDQIANTMGNIGQIQSQGIIGAAQSKQAGSQAGFGNIMGLASLGLMGYGMFSNGSGSMFSDIRLKENIIKTGETRHPNINKYDWIWNDDALPLGLSGCDSGYIAQEVEYFYPEFVETHPSGYKRIDIDGLEKVLNDV